MKCSALSLCWSLIWNENKYRSGKTFVIINLPSVVTAARKAISLVFRWTKKKDFVFLLYQPLAIAIFIVHQFIRKDTTQEQNGKDE